MYFAGECHQLGCQGLLRSSPSNCLECQTPEPKFLVTLDGVSLAVLRAVLSGFTVLLKMK